MPPPQTARQEWATAWPLPFLAMFGLAGSTIFPTSSGVFMETLTGVFGWSRAAFAASFLFQVMLGLIVMPLAGRVADRIGARKVALVGILPFGVSLSLLGLASGSIWQWWGLCLLNASTLGCVCPAIWMKPVVMRFSASRGLALAVALGGFGLSTAIWPLLAAIYIETWGWRLAYLALSVTWSVPMLLLTWLLFDRRDRSASAPPPTRQQFALMPSLVSRTFLCLAAAGGVFSFVSYGMFIQLVPILQHSGFSLGVAASIASVFGMSSIIGRLLIGALLDRLPTRALGVAVFLLPVVSLLLLWQNNGSLALAMAAAAVFGIAGGAETDILAYLAAKRFPQTMFASIYAVATALFAISASCGPLFAAILYDTYQSYTPAILSYIPLIMFSAFLIWLIPSRHGVGGVAVATAGSTACRQHAD